MLKELGLVPKDLTIWVVASVQEEDCDGLCWQYIVKESKLRPEVVVSTEPTSLQIYHGHRGRMEIEIETKGYLAICLPQTRRERRLQDGRYHQGHRKAQRKPALDEAAGQGHGHHQPHPFDFAEPVRGGRQPARSISTAA